MFKTLKSKKVKVISFSVSVISALLVGACSNPVSMEGTEDNVVQSADIKKEAKDMIAKAEKTKKKCEDLAKKYPAKANEKSIKDNMNRAKQDLIDAKRDYDVKQWESAESKAHGANMVYERTSKLFEPQNFFKKGNPPKNLSTEQIENYAKTTLISDWKHGYLCLFEHADYKGKASKEFKIAIDAQGDVNDLGTGGNGDLKANQASSLYMVRAHVQFYSGKNQTGQKVIIITPDTHGGQYLFRRNLGTWSDKISSFRMFKP